MSSKGWVNDVIGACIAAGIEQYVVCSGARNMDLVASLAEYASDPDHGRIRLVHHFDERAAGFFALGLSMKHDAPCAVLTTSGTAVAELLPAVIEAHYQRRPLVVISADRPLRFRGSGAPQAIEQFGLFASYVEGCEDLGWQDMLELFDGWSGQGPWHLNLCLEEKESDLKGNTRLSKVRLGEIGAPQESANMLPVLEMMQNAWKGGMVVMLGGLEPGDREEVWHFLKDLAVPVLADSTSGLREVLGKWSLVNGDRVLRDSPPSFVLRIGEVPVGRFWRDLEELPEVKVVSLSRTGFSGLGRESEVIHGDISRLIRALGEVRSVGDTVDLLRDTGRRAGRISERLEAFPESEPGMVRMLSVLATVGQSLYLGNSLPIREWNDFAQREIPYEVVRANRGANGIDGQIATWLGATADEQDAWGVFGDLTTLYDLSAPSLLSQVECRGRVLVVINNGGGRIFARLPQLQGLSEEVKGMVTNSHQTGFESWASMWGMRYIRVSGMEDFDFEPAEVTTVVEVIPDDRQTDAFWKAMKAK